MAATLCVTVLTVNMFLSVFCPPGVLTERCEGATPSLFIRAPKKMEALSGTCLLIPCSFTPKEGYINNEVSAGWIKSGETIFDIRNSVKTFTVKRKKMDCTSVFPDLNMSHSGKYFFRVEKETFKATAVCDPLHMTVQDSAWSPSIKVSGDLNDLKEGESVSITCSAQTPCPNSPPELTWSLQQDSQRKQKNPDGTFTTKIQKNITLSDTHDGDNIRCSVRYPVDGGKRKKTAEINLTLSVSYAPKDTSASISPSGVVSAGSWVELGCSSRAKPPVRTFNWFRNTKHGPVHVSEGQVYSFNVSEGGEFYCVALNDLGNQSSPVILLNLEVSLRNKHLWLAAVLFGLIVLIVLILTVWFFKSKRRTPPETQSQKAEEVSAWKQDSETEEELHYGDVSFFKNRPEASSASEQDGGQQETVYAQVNLSTPGNCLTQTAGGPEELYAQIKK